MREAEQEAILLGYGAQDATPRPPEVTDHSVCRRQEDSGRSPRPVIERWEHAPAPRETPDPLISGVRLKNRVVAFLELGKPRGEVFG